MDVEIRYWRDAEGNPHASSAAMHHDSVAKCLEFVVREGDGLIEWLLETLDAVISGQEPEGQQMTIGGSYITIERKETEIYHDSDEPYSEGEPAPDCLIDTIAFRNLLVRWQSFLRSNGDNG